MHNTSMMETSIQDGEVGGTQLLPAHGILKNKYGTKSWLLKRVNKIHIPLNKLTKERKDTD
jgi:hypothetical protein